MELEEAVERRKLGTFVNRVPNAVQEGFVVARVSGGELWYWDAFDNEPEAKRSAKECGGFVLFNI